MNNNNNNNNNNNGGKGKSALESYCMDLTQRAKDGNLDPVIGRTSEISRLVRILSRRRKSNAVLVGPAGVGKTAIAEGLALRMADGDVPSSLQNKALYALDVGLLVAGASYKGEFEQRLKDVLKELEEKNALVFIDEMHLLVGAGAGGGSMDAANMLKPALARGDITCIGATTSDEYQQYIEGDAALARRFQSVTVNEPSVEDAVTILRGLSETYSAHHGLTIKDGALVAAATWAKRYLTNRRLPDSAIDLLDEACAQTRVALDSKPEKVDALERRLEALRVQETALGREKDKASQARLEQTKTTIKEVEAELKPLVEQYERENERINELRNLQKKRQQLNIKLADAQRRKDNAAMADLQYGAIPDLDAKLEAVKAKRAREEAEREDDDDDQHALLTEIVTAKQIAEVVSRWTGIPVSKMTTTERDALLQLPTRLSQRVVGQEEAVREVSEAILRTRAGLAREGQPPSFMLVGTSGTGKTELAKALAGELFDNEDIVRIDCSEYQEPHSIARLVGAPPGYVGFDKGGILTEAVNRKPYTIVLFDEIEKAHQDVLLILLQLLDEGKLTDSHGKVVDFSNTIVMLTSNVGSDLLTQQRSATASPVTSDDEGNPPISKRQRLVTDPEPISPATRERVMDRIRAHFRPEFLNRLSAIVLFNPLSLHALKEIVRIQARDLSRRLADRGIELDLQESGVEAILAQSYVPEWGARPIRRYIDRTIATELSRRILADEVGAGCIVVAESHNGVDLEYRILGSVPKKK